MATISFWIKSLKVIPQVSKDEWITLDIIFKITRSGPLSSFIMTAISCTIGGYWPFIIPASLTPLILLSVYWTGFCKAANNY